jgi:hypothetical protein
VRAKSTAVPERGTKAANIRGAHYLGFELINPLLTASRRLETALLPE